jgi:hypothetical protein
MMRSWGNLRVESSLEFLSFFATTNNPSLKRKRFLFLSREGSAWVSIVLEVEQKLHKEIK